jgi:hypothetical protein
LRYEEFLVLTSQAGAFVRGGQVLADGTVQGSSTRLLVEFPLECYELYAHTNIDNYTNEDETVLQLNDDSIYQEDKQEVAEILLAEI